MSSISRVFGFALALSIGILVAAHAATAKAEEWGRFYHWPYSNFHQYQWTPYEYEQVHDGNYRYPKQMRVEPSKFGSRDWSTVRKPYYRGNHFILDRF